MNSFKHTKYFLVGAGFFWFMLSWFFLEGGMSLAAGVQGGANNHLHRAKIYLAAGDYRRAVEACHAMLMKLRPWKVTSTSFMCTMRLMDTRSGLPNRINGRCGTVSAVDGESWGDGVSRSPEYAISDGQRNLA